MKIIISNEAFDWFKNEMEVKPGDFVNFFARYGGSSPLHEAFSLGVTKVEPDEPAAQVEIEGVLYYIERKDEWFFDGHDLLVGIDAKLQEPTYSYKK